MNKLRLLLVDDHEIVRKGLTYVLAAIRPEWTVVEAASGFEALGLLREQRFDAAVFDISMPGMTGLELINRTRAHSKTMPILVLSMHSEDEYAVRSLKAGANGYLMKTEASEELVNAVQLIVAGGVYASDRLAQKVLIGLHHGTTGHSASEKLSDREFDVLCRIVSGQNLSRIADDLHLSIKTISSHKRRIMDKLELGSAAALIRYGLEHGLCNDDSGALAHGPSLE